MLMIAYSRRIVVIAMDREDGYSDVDVRILVVDMVERTASTTSASPTSQMIMSTDPANVSLPSLNISSSHGFSP